MIAQGWTLWIGIAALALAILATAVSLLRGRGTWRPGLDPAGAGAALIVMGIALGGEPALGWVLITAGVVVSVGSTVLGARGARGG